MRALLWYRSVVDHQHGIVAAGELIRLHQQFGFNWRRIPDSGGNEVMQLIAFAERKPFRHRLNAFAIARTDQPRHVERTHLSPRLMPQPVHKRLEKAPKLLFPV